jgi:alpha-glucosidase
LNEELYAQKLFSYVMSNKDVISVESIFSDETENFVTPTNIDFGQPFEIKIRTAKNNIDKVFLCERNKNNKFLMSKKNYDNLFDYFL